MSRKIKVLSDLLQIEWVANAWEKVTNEIEINYFQVCGITTDKLKKISSQNGSSHDSNDLNDISTCIIDGDDDWYNSAVGINHKHNALKYFYCVLLDMFALFSFITKKAISLFSSALLFKVGLFLRKHGTCLEE